MLSRFNPEAVKQAIKAAVSHALDRFKNDVRWQRQADWFAAAVATGAAKQYRLGFMRLRDAWRNPTDRDIVVAIKDCLTKVHAAEFEKRATIWDPTDASPRGDNANERAVVTLRNRMSLQLAMHGLQYALDVRHHARMTLVPNIDIVESDDLLETDSDLSGTDSAILAFAEKLSDLDERLHRQLIALSSAARTETLVAMRSLMRPNDFLPWWLDGTLETVAAAQTVDSEKRGMLNAILERYAADPEFLQMLVPAIDGPRATIDDREVYAWTLPDGEDAEPRRIELKVPARGSRGRVLELRVGEPVGASVPDGLIDRDNGFLDDLKPDYGFLVGRVMLLNGLPFLWFNKPDGRPTAKVTMGSAPPLPVRGQMQLFDCSTNQVLKPVSPV